MAIKIIGAEVPTLQLVSKCPYEHADTNLDMAVKALKPVTLLKRMGANKRSGDPIEAILYTIFLLPLLKIRSIHFFFNNNLNRLLSGGKDVVYSFMENQSTNWSLLALKVSLSLFNTRKWNRDINNICAFTVDDTIKERYGKKVEATSVHYDHNRGGPVRGHQVLQLGISNVHDGFLPLLAHFFVSKKKRAPLSKGFKDKRQAVSKSYHDAHELTKHELLAQMLRRAINFGFSATYLLGDAWFGCKKNVKLALSLDLVAIFMMKRGRTKYRLDGKLYSAKGLYRLFRAGMIKIKDKSFHACSINVEYNISADIKNPEWIQIRLIFSRMKSAPKSSWVVLLCTDDQIDLEKILEIYALRWNIEVYFKEVKQYFGFLSEQSWQYTVCVASVHLAMIRYTLFYYLSLVHSTFNFSQFRNQISMNMVLFSYGMIV
ncbi:MAG: transposase [Proteobacteria bacterium]|nr:transposase [Pseudomonadota bacterium]